MNQVTIEQLNTATVDSTPLDEFDTLLADYTTARYASETAAEAAARKAKFAAAIANRTNQ